MRGLPRSRGAERRLNLPGATVTTALDTLPTRPRELALLRRYHDRGDVLAREQLIEQHLPLVRMLARPYCRRGEPLEDLVQIGTIGLIKAIDRFDLSRGVAFSTYATPTIVGEIRRHFRDRAWMVRVPRRLRQLNGRLPTLADELAGRLGRQPTTAELARAAGATEDEVSEARGCAHAHAPLSLSPWDGGGGDGHELDPLETLGAPDHRYELVEQRAALRSALRTLDERERTILQLRFVEDQVQAEIAGQLGISQMHVSRLIRRALDKLAAAIAPNGR